MALCLSAVDKEEMVWKMCKTDLGMQRPGARVVGVGARCVLIANENLAYRE